VEFSVIESFQRGHHFHPLEKKRRALHLAGRVDGEDSFNR
jgi:hypothetical protein